MAEFEALGFSAGEGVEGLAELEVAEADLDEGGEDSDDGLVALGVGGGDAFLILVEFDGFGDGGVEDAVDGFSPVEKIECGGLVASSFAIGRGAGSGAGSGAAFSWAITGSERHRAVKRIHCFIRSPPGMNGRTATTAYSCSPPFGKPLHLQNFPHLARRQAPACHRFVKPR